MIWIEAWGERKRRGGRVTKDSLKLHGRGLTIGANVCFEGEMGELQFINECVR